MILQCTKKVLDKLEIQDIASYENVDNKLEKWHCNLIKFGRDNAILITHDTTIFSFFLYGFKANEFKNFEEVISQNIFKILLNLDFEQKKIEIILNSLQNILYTKSSSRSILASMNQVMTSVDSFLYRDKGNIYDLHKYINEHIHKVIDYDKPIERFDKLLDSMI
jgi:hypothetical protein